MEQIYHLATEIILGEWEMKGGDAKEEKIF